jgi:hypothetical protein
MNGLKTYSDLNLNLSLPYSTQNSKEVFGFLLSPSTKSDRKWCLARPKAKGKSGVVEARGKFSLDSRERIESSMSEKEEGIAVFLDPQLSQPGRVLPSRFDDSRFFYR